MEEDEASIPPSQGWCELSPGCPVREDSALAYYRTSSASFDDDYYYYHTSGSGSGSGNGSNGTQADNATCGAPFCPNILLYSIDNSKARVYDLFLLLCSIVFLGFLFIQLASTLKKLHHSLPLFRLLYGMMFLIPIMSCAYEATSLIKGYQSNATKVMHVFLRGSILVTELSVVIFGIFIKLCGSSALKLTATVAGIVGVSVVFTAVQGVLEFRFHNSLPCHNYNFFTHGGMIFLFTTSVLFAVAYATIFLVYILNLYKRWNLPTKKSFYRYALFLCMVNAVQAVGSLLWFTGKDRPVSGNAGICLTIIPNVIYVVSFAPVVYWIFLSNYFRMNDSLMSVETSTGKINEVPDAAVDPSKRKRHHKRSISNPLDIGRKKRGMFADHTSLIAESYESSSYGSLDEEAFVRHEQVSPCN